MTFRISWIVNARIYTKHSRHISIDIVFKYTLSSNMFIVIGKYLRFVTVPNN